MKKLRNILAAAGLAALSLSSVAGQTVRLYNLNQTTMNGLRGRCVGSAGPSTHIIDAWFPLAVETALRSDPHTLRTFATATVPANAGNEAFQVRAKVLGFDEWGTQVAETTGATWRFGERSTKPLGEVAFIPAGGNGTFTGITQFGVLYTVEGHFNVGGIILTDFRRPKLCSIRAEIHYP
jgi:hypothetical protein